jgi:hypothetical protein
MDYDGPTPDPSWQAELSAIAPRSSQLSWLLLVWEPGVPWEPLHRWTIWQMYPDGMVPERHLESLPIEHRVGEEIAAHPRSTGHPCYPGWCTCAIKANRWRGGPRAAIGISTTTWDLFRRTGCYGRRWWVVQGDHGGHRYVFDDVESQTAVANGHEAQPPKIGELAFAAPSRATVRQVAAWDRQRKWEEEFFGAYTARSEAQDDARRADERRAAARSLSRWIDDQLIGPADRLRRVLRRHDDIPRAAPWDRAPRVDYDRAEADFVESVADSAA